MHEEESSVDPHVARVHVPVRVRLQFSSISCWANLNFPWNQKIFVTIKFFCSRVQNPRMKHMRAFPNFALPTTEFRNYSGPAWERSCGGVRIKDKTENLSFLIFYWKKFSFSKSKQYVFSNGLLSIEMVWFFSEKATEQNNEISIFRSMPIQLFLHRWRKEEKRKLKSDAKIMPHWHRRKKWGDKNLFQQFSFFFSFAE